MRRLIYRGSKSVVDGPSLRETATTVEQSKLQVRFGSRLRQIRKSANISQESLADMASMGRHALSSIENGKTNVSLDTIRRLAEALNVTLAELMPDYSAKVE